MAAIPQPFFLDREQIVEAMNELAARHDAAGEEMPGDPVRLSA